MAGLDLPVRAIREQTSSALDLIIHLSRLRDGSRRITQLAEVEGMEGEVVTMNNIAEFDYSRGGDGESLGSLRPTGYPAEVQRQAVRRGISLPPGVFANDASQIAIAKRQR